MSGSSFRSSTIVDWPVTAAEDGAIEAPLHAMLVAIEERGLCMHLAPKSR